MVLRWIYVSCFLFVVSSAVFADPPSSPADSPSLSGYMTRGWICAMPNYGIIPHRRCYAWGANREEAQRNFQRQCMVAASIIEPECYEADGGIPH